MEEQPVITPFEIGVVAALTVVGVSLAALDINLRHKLIEAVEAMKTKLPQEPKFHGGESVHHAALEALLLGLVPIPSGKSGD